MALKKSTAIADVLRALNQKAPLETAEEWDQVGLLAGDMDGQTTGAVLSVDLTFEAVELAVKKHYSLILNHHPCIFPKQRGLSRILAGTPLYEAVRNNISVAAYHTNFDRCALEVIEKVSKGLGIEPKGRLIEKSKNALLKLVTYVPKTHAEKVREALCLAGAGHIGKYDQCTFSGEGVGTFRGAESTRPYLGSPGLLERAEEVRLETIIPRGLESFVMETLRKTHPYEEIAADLYPVEQKVGAVGLVKGLGYGFWGEFPGPRAFSDLTKDVKSLFGIHGFWITNPVPDFVTRVGFVAGKGSSFVDAASALKCDLLITGEAGYHAALGSSRRGVGVMEIGHQESEWFFTETVKDWLSGLSLEFEEVKTSTQKIWQEV